MNPGSSPVVTQPQASAWVRHFARLTTSGRIIPEVDGLRFFAIAGVVLYHCWTELAIRNGIENSSSSFTGFSGVVHAILSRGHYGVQLFFVISGYVLSLPFAENNQRGLPSPPLGRYFLRRVTRLEPPYLVNLVISYLVVASAFYLGIRSRGAGFAGLLPHLGASAIYSHGFIYHDLSWINGVTWSLEVEVQFYVLMPLLAFVAFQAIAGKMRGWVLGGVILAIGVALDRAAPDQWYFTYSLAGYLNFFLTGILWADLSVRYPLDDGRRSGAWDVAALSAVGLFALPNAWMHFEAHYPLLFGIFCLAGMRGRFLKAFLALEPVWLTGGMCYTIYLYHLLVITVGVRLLRILFHPAFPFWGNFLIQLPLLVVLILISSALLFVAIERPCMDKAWPRKFWRWVRREPRVLPP